MNEPFLGMIALFGFNFAPRGWAFCNGQLLSIAQNTALFSLLGTQYGGDGVQTFALPDLRGRVALSQGQGNGLSPRTIGEISGSESVTILSSQMPAHTHTLSASASGASTGVPTNNLLASANGSLEDGTAVTVNTYSSAAPDTALNPASIGATGGGQPVGIMPPYLVLNYCIALEGIFPSRN